MSSTHIYLYRLEYFNLIEMQLFVYDNDDMTMICYKKKFFFLSSLFNVFIQPNQTKTTSIKLIIIIIFNI